MLRLFLSLFMVFIQEDAIQRRIKELERKYNENVRRARAAEMMNVPYDGQVNGMNNVSQWNESNIPRSTEGFLSRKNTGYYDAYDSDISLERDPANPDVATGYYGGRGDPDKIDNEFTGFRSPGDSCIDFPKF